jgi:superfamily II DNA or RNA helicase
VITRCHPQPDAIDNLERLNLATVVTPVAQIYGCPDEPFGVFMQAAAQLSQGGNDDSKATRCARRYLNAFNKRRALMADCGRKLEALGLLSPVLSRAERALVFTETVPGANSAATTLSALGVSAKAYTSKLATPIRKAMLERFRAGTIRVLAAPRVLDEGIDVPEADVGVIVAASRSRRQMIQRMGRVMRPKPDGGRATFLILYVRDTSGSWGAHRIPRRDRRPRRHGALLPRRRQRT